MSFSQFKAEYCAQTHKVIGFIISYCSLNTDIRLPDIVWKIGWSFKWLGISRSHQCFVKFLTLNKIIYPIQQKELSGKLSSGQDLPWIIKITVTAVQHKTYMYIYTRYTVSTYIRPVYTKYTETFWIIQELSDYLVKS